MNSNSEILFTDQNVGILLNDEPEYSDPSEHIQRPILFTMIHYAQSKAFCWNSCEFFEMEMFVIRFSFLFYLLFFGQTL